MTGIVRVIEKLPRYHDNPGFFRVADYLKAQDIDPGAFAVILGGTNGKGSLGVMLESILAEAGISAGCFRSPHVYSFYERITINRQPISPDDFHASAVRVLDYFSRAGVSPTFSDVLTGIAYTHFARARCRVMLMEVGMGGLHDPVNALPRQLTLITNIGHDHSHVLGSYPLQIARRKAAIVRPGVPLITAEKKPAVLDVFREICANQDAPLMVADRTSVTGVDVGGTRFVYQGREYATALCGVQQGDNAAMAIEGIKVMRRFFNIHPDSVLQGLSKARLPWRMEVFCRNPGIIFDGSHNRESWENLADTLSAFSFRNLHIILCIQKLKNPQDFPRHMPGGEVFVYLPRCGGRFHSPGDIAQSLSPRWKATTHGGLPGAVDKALNMMSRDDLLVFAGSFGIASRVRKIIKGRLTRDKVELAYPGGI